MEMLSIIFYKLLQMSVIASIIGIATLFIKKLLHKYISPKMLYIMWLIFLISLVIPPFIQTRASVYNYIDIYKIEYFANDYDIQPQVSTQSFDEIQKNEKTIEESVPNDMQDTKPIPNLKDVFPVIWIAGVGVLFSIYFVSNIVFKIKIGNKKFEDGRIKSILQIAKDNIKIKKNIELIDQDVIKTPAIIGVIKPKILLTYDINSYSDSEIEYIFRHELAHYKRKDNVINCILILLRTVHWFNPIVWIMIREIRKDMEFTADERAVKGLGQEDRKEYCKLLVNITNNVHSSFMEKTIGITDNKSNLEKRIHMIKLSDKLSKHPVFAAFLVFIIIGVICVSLYTTNYYQPDLELPPKIYLESPNGKKTEMLLTKYQWINGEEVKNYNIEFDPDTYEFGDKNTIYATGKAEDDYLFTLKTMPKYKMNYFDQTYYNKHGAGENDLDHYVSRRDLVPELYDVEYENVMLENGIYQIDVFFPNGSTARYAVRTKTYDFLDIKTIKKYSDTDINEKSQIEKLVKEMRMSEFLNNIKIENNVLSLHYQYVQEKSYAYNMALVLFVNIPKLDKIIFTTEQKNAEYAGLGEKYDTSVPLEITRENVNQNTSITLEELQKIIRES